MTPRDTVGAGHEVVRWHSAKLKYVTGLRYGDSLPQRNADAGDGRYQVFGSNGPYGSHSEANTGSPVIIIGRKGSYGKINWSSRRCFASDTTFFADESVCKHDLRWLYWLLHTLALDEGTDEAAVPGLSRETAYAIAVRIPPRTQQREIAEYLDRLTARLDALMAEKERLTSLLEERRAALVARVVLRGVDDEVVLRDSGIPWIGEIPEHWNVWKLGHLASIGSGSTPSRSRSQYWEGGDVPWLNSSAVAHQEVTAACQFVTRFALRQCHLPLVSSGAVLVAIAGQGKTRGRSAVLSIDATINQHLAFIIPRDARLSSWYLRWVLCAAYGFLRAVSDDVGGTKGALTCEELANLRVPVPPSVEQQKIITEVALRVRSIDELGAATLRTVALLKERRSAAIAAAVAGRVGVEVRSEGY